MKKKKRISRHVYKVGVLTPTIGGLMNKKIMLLERPMRGLRVLTNKLEKYYEVSKRR